MNTAVTSEKHIHLISFDIPVPTNYGGVIDIYFKIKAFKEEGIRVHLHCFQYDREKSPLLNQLCESVDYYKRDLSIWQVFSGKPFIATTRSAGQLLRNLERDNYPVIFEGLHTCYYLTHKSLLNRKKIVRTHNIEHEYYKSLGRVEKNIFKRRYFFTEAFKLKRFENILNAASAIAAISANDAVHFSERFPEKEIRTVSAFHPHEKVQIQEGMGDFALYHGSLEVGENNKSAVFLVEEVFNDLDIPFIIAGNKPSDELITVAGKYNNVKLMTGLSTEKIYELVTQAQINILPTFQATGIKLKLLTALFTGRHCIVNPPMVDATGLDGLCSIHDEPAELKKAVTDLFSIPFTAEDINIRRRVLEESIFSNSFNINKLIELIFSEQ